MIEAADGWNRCFWKFDTLGVRAVVESRMESIKMAVAMRWSYCGSQNHNRELGRQL